MGARVGEGSSERPSSSSSRMTDWPRDGGVGS